MSRRKQLTPAVSPTVSEQIAKWFHLPEESLRLIKSSIGRELELGLRDEESATIKMLITYVRELSRGDEIGSYLALDLGGTHFRVLLVTLNGDGSEPKVVSAMHDIPQAMLVTQNGQELFDYIALKLLEFVQQYKLQKRRISLGFTFSFPCKQYGLTQSILVKWCKGFNVGGVIGTDVVKQLKNALKRQLAGLVQAYIDVVAVINDTTGTLVACANKNRDCRIGLIVGTGYNACYMERLDRCDKWPANYTSPKEVIINCEWGALGDNRERRELDKFRNELDARVDQESVNPNNQTYEKMVSGMYVGELLRLAMLELFKARLLFQNSGTRKSPGGATDTDKPKSAPSALKAKSSDGSLLGVEGPVTDSLRSSRSISTAQAKPKSPVSAPAKAGKQQATKQEQEQEQMQQKPRKSSHSPGSPKQSSTSSKSRASTSPKGLAATSRTSMSNVNNSVRATSSSLARNGRPEESSPNGEHKLDVKDILNGKHLSMLAQDELAGNFNETVKLMKELNISNYSEADLVIIIKLGAAIMSRAASLVACGIASLLDRMQRPYTVIGYDGSLIKHHPYFLKLISDKTSLLTAKEYKFKFVQSSDGSGIGAAVVAAALHKERRPLYVVKPGKLYEMHFVRPI